MYLTHSTLRNTLQTSKTLRRPRNTAHLNICLQQTQLGWTTWVSHDRRLWVQLTELSSAFLRMETSMLRPAKCLVRGSPGNCGPRLIYANASGSGTWICIVCHHFLGSHCPFCQGSLNSESQAEGQPCRHPMGYKALALRFPFSDSQAVQL